MNIKLRLEQQADFRRVEEITRIAFSYPGRVERGGIGCPFEHWMVNELRNRDGYTDLSIVATINEEIVRLKSHIKSIFKEITENPTPGKRLDFICQEMNREVNTIGSKNQFIEIAEQVINAKDALENIREQSKNIE